MQATSSQVIPTASLGHEIGFVPSLTDSDPDPLSVLMQSAVASKRIHLLVRRRKRSNRRAVRS